MKYDSQKAKEVETKTRKNNEIIIIFFFAVNSHKFLQ